MCHLKDPIDGSFGRLVCTYVYNSFKCPGIRTVFTRRFLKIVVGAVGSGRTLFRLYWP